MQQKSIYLLALLFYLFLPFQAQSENKSSSIQTLQSDSLKVGVVLSGGGARGVAHIGILKALEEAGVQIDYITGTSMGSLIGGLYAIGYSADQLIELSKTSNFMELFTEKPNRRYTSNYEKGFDGRTILTVPISESGLSLPQGIITGQNIYTYISRLVWSAHGTDDFDNFPIPFATIATDIETGEAVVFRSGYLPDAIRASISIPSAIAPHEINGKYYVDGGLARNLPVQDAIKMGANYIIAVDVSTPLAPSDSLNTLTEIMNQSVQYRINERVQQEKKKADLVITMPEMDKYSIASFDLMQTFLEIGLEAGEKYSEEFKKIAERQKHEYKPRKPIDAPSPLPIQDVIIEGNNLFDDDFIKRKLQFETGAKLGPEMIDEKISRLYSSQYIEQVTYRIKPDTLYYYNLHVNIKENQSNDFKVGLRYESQTQASILFEASFQNLFHDGSINKLESRLGDQLMFGADYIYYGALGSRFAALTSLEFNRESVDWFVNKERVSRFENHIIRGEVSFGNYFSTQHLFALGIRKDFTYRGNEINPEQVEPVNDGYHALFAKYRYDFLNRKSYPTSGQKVLAEFFYSDAMVFSPIQFSSVKFYWKGFYELSSKLSLTNSLLAGYSYGNELPWGYWYTPNSYYQDIGYLRFGGIDRYEVSTPHVQMASLGIQAEPFYHRFINIDFYAGRFLEDWNLNPKQNDIDYGASLSLGALTVVGPIKVTLSTGTVNSFQAELQIGYQF
ncbi:patatin-like phospholipase family protein [Rhodohalobacter sp.]|uniref:patatin-like phospholipase family protein n=1 Tax=Rhodohalobacter sp. TaxID=1974210 RepID=UPI002ACD5749|nr:patatin-like phospholipase family protein [Rhodohalobacter sp.]MDZ7757334.1 patatin-like phospholipase family protein [Rhodohalobacter sp.]